MVRLVVLVLMLPGLFGCGLIDSNIADFDLSMPEKEFTVDTSQWQLTDEATFPSIPCADTPAVCASGIAEVCGNEAICFGACADATCKATVLISLYQAVNLYDEKPELQTINDQPLVSVTVDRVSYDVTENTFNIDSPVITVYVAPENVTNPGDPQARAVGTVAPVPAETLVTDQEVDMSPEGRADLREFMKDYKTTFNILVGAQVEIGAGDVVPTGRLRAVVNVAAHAGL